MYFNLWEDGKMKNYFFFLNIKHTIYTRINNDTEKINLLL